MISELIKLANYLDEKGHAKKAARVDHLIKKIAYLPAGYFTDVENLVPGTDEEHADAIVRSLCDQGLFILFEHNNYDWKYSCEEDTYDLWGGPGVSDRGKALFKGLSSSDTGRRLESWNTLNDDKLNWKVEFAGDRKWLLDIADFISYEPKQVPGQDEPVQLVEAPEADPLESNVAAFAQKYIDNCNLPDWDTRGCVTLKKGDDKLNQSFASEVGFSGRQSVVVPDSSWYVKIWEPERSYLPVLLMVSLSKKETIGFARDIYRFSYSLGGNIGVQDAKDGAENENEYVNQLYSWSMVVGKMEAALDDAAEKYPAGSQRMVDERPERRRLLSLINPSNWGGNKEDRET